LTDFDDPVFRDDGGRLIQALERFRVNFGFGRAIAAPQIGIARRMIAMNLGAGPFLLVNPELSGLSRERFTMWDDCMSFPWLMIRVQRCLHLDLRFQDEGGRAQSWTKVDQAVSELLQHEVDHLDGILAIDHALDRDAIVARTVYEARRRYYDRQVDYTIVATVK
jgi:peptide deformylase